jgi:5-methylcytosine-specific restriction protein A
MDGPAARRLHPDTWAGAEEQIASFAASSGATPNDVAGFARDLLEALDEDGAPPEEGPELVNELHLSRNASGTGGRVKGQLDGPTYEALITAIAALSKPLPGVEATQAERQAHALGEICGFTLRHDTTLPDSGGERPQIRVTVDLERLRQAVAGAHLDTGAYYTADQLRMLACEAFIIPAILNGKSEVLDIGRASRTIPTGIRRAVAIRDRGCAYPGCNRPPSHCDVHHCQEWCDDGVTAVHNCVMLCKAHHLIVHGTKWTVRIHHGQPEFVPPAFIDPGRQIRRKPQLAHD